MNLVVKTRIKLLQKQPFFGRLALLLTIEEADYIPTLCTDGETLFYNMDFVKSLDDQMRIAAVLHEVLHCALGHLWRRGNRNQHLWNYATDYAVNSLLIRNSLPIPTGGLYNANYVDMSAEQIYEKIKKTAKNLDCGFHMQVDLNDQKNQQGDGDDESDDQKKQKGGAGGSKPQDDDQDGGDKKKKGKGGGNGKDPKKQPGCDVCKAHQMWDKMKANPKKAKKVQRRFEATMEQIARERGKVPAGFERIIEQLKPQEDWRKILMNYLSTSKNDYNFMRRDRRTLDWDFYMPDLMDEEKLEDIVVAVDTSGSIGQAELSAFISEVRSILKLFPHTKGWLIDCDAEVNQFIEIDKAAAPTMRFYGGGGTSHVPVFKEITKRNVRPKVLLAFTDMYTEFPSTHPNYPVLWLATPGTGNMPAPFGRVIELKKSFVSKEGGGY